VRVGRRALHEHTGTPLHRALRRPGSRASHMSGAEERLANDPTSELWASTAVAIACCPIGGKQVLDVASGGRFWPEMLRQAGDCPIGVDYDAHALSQVRCLEAKARLVHADATRLPFHAHSLDLVCRSTTSTCPTPRAGQRVRRVLKPGGRRCLSTPNRASGPEERHTRIHFTGELTADERAT